MDNNKNTTKILKKKQLWSKMSKHHQTNDDGKEKTNIPSTSQSMLRYNKKKQ